MSFASNESPRAVFESVITVRRLRLIVVGDSTIEIVGLLNGESPGVVFEKVCPKWSGRVWQAPRDELSS
jgi:hypothetical protein